MSFFTNKVLPVALLAFGIGGCWVLASLKADPGQKTPESNIPKVRVEPIDRNVGAIDVNVNGNVMPHREIRIAAEVAGRIIEKSTDIRAGRYIEAGTELCKIDPEPYELELQRLDRELTQNEVDLRQLELEATNTDRLIELARKDVDRAERDVQRLKDAQAKSTIVEVVTAAQIDSAEGEVTRMENALQTLLNTKSLIPTRKEKLEAQKSLVETRKKIAQLDKDRTIVKAPISGVIATESIEQGDFVQRGTELLIVEDVSQMEVSCSLLTEDLYWIWALTDRSSLSLPQMGARDFYQVPDISATITLSVGEQKFSWAGQLVRFEGSAMNERTRTVPCRIRVDEALSQRGGAAPPSLARGMFVSVTLHVPPTGNLVRIPEEALRMNGRIYTTSMTAGEFLDGAKDAKLHIHKVQVARAIPGAVLVQQDTINPPLPPGAQLIVSPLLYASDDMDVVIVADRESEDNSAPTNN